MLPSASFNSVGSATPGTIFGGPFEGPLTCQETGLAFLRTDRAVTIKDSVAVLTSTGGALALNHAYLISVGNVQNVIGIIYSSDVTPGSARAVALSMPLTSACACGERRKSTARASVGAVLSA